MKRHHRLGCLFVLLLIVLGSALFTSPLPARSFSLTVLKPDDTLVSAWLQDWETQLPVTATLKVGSESSNFGINSDTLRVYKTHLELTNQTSFTLTTGSNQYLIETSNPQSTGDNRQTFEVAFGDFVDEPSQDFAGIADYRGEAIEDEDTVSLLNYQRLSESGGWIRNLGAVVNFSFEKDKEYTPDFGSAAVGKDLVVDSEMQLGVYVIPERLDKVIMISPELKLQDSTGMLTVFRYLLTFQVDTRSLGGQERTGKLLGAQLIPMTADALTPLFTDNKEALWKRVFAAHWASEFVPADTAEALLKLAVAKGEQNDALRIAAISGLGSAKYAQALVPISALLNDKTESDSIRAAAIHSLGVLGDKAATLLLLSLAQGDGEREARRAILALGLLGDKAATVPLLDLLATDESDGLGSALEDSLSRLVDDSAVERLAQLAHVPNTGIAKHAVNVLGALSTRPALVALGKMFPSVADEVKVTICQVIAESNTTEALELLKIGLADENLEVAEAAADALVKLKNPSRLVVLKDALDSSIAQSQVAVLRALADEKFDELGPSIIALLLDSKVTLDVRTEAANTLGTLPGEDSVNALLTILGEPSAELRVQALKTLGSLEAKQAVVAISQLLSDTDPLVREAAADALGDIGDKAGLENLEAAALKETNAAALSAELDALEKFEYADLNHFLDFVHRLLVIREDAGRSALRYLLERLSNESYGPTYGATEAEVLESIAKWEDWWEKVGSKKLR